MTPEQAASLNRAISLHRGEWGVESSLLSADIPNDYCTDWRYAGPLLSEMLSGPAVNPRIEMIRRGRIDVATPEPKPGTLRVGIGLHIIYFDKLEPHHVAEAYARVHGLEWEE